MDELTKYRITGALVWLGLLIFIVPNWYSDPVDYVKSQQVFKIETFTQSEGLDKTVKSSLSEPVVVPIEDKAPAVTHPVSLPPLNLEKHQTEPIGQWLVRLVSYSNIQSANRMVDQLAGRYQATIGDFSTQDRRIYSVRVGPFDSLAQAQQAKNTLDAEFNIDAVVVRVR
jgi:cell division septation protein DedD